MTCGATATTSGRSSAWRCGAGCSVGQRTKLAGTPIAVRRWVNWGTRAGFRTAGTAPVQLVVRADPGDHPDQHRLDATVSRAAAVVTDVGAPLSHAAIFARELGVPAVVGCGNATTRISTGDRIRVDGACGTVTPLEPSDD